MCAGGCDIYGPKSALVLDEPVSKHGAEVADRLAMTSAEQCSDLDHETARIRASGRVLRLPRRRLWQSEGRSGSADRWYWSRMRRASMLERRRFTSRYHRIVMRNLRAGSAASPATQCTCRLARPCRIQTCGDGSRQGYNGSPCFRYWRSAGFKVYLVKMHTI